MTGTTVKPTITHYGFNDIVPPASNKYCHFFAITKERSRTPSSHKGVGVNDVKIEH
jgi:hypothetical protein